MLKRMFFYACAGVVMMSAVTDVAAQAPAAPAPAAQGIRITGQIRPRIEVRNRTGAIGASNVATATDATDAVTTMRTRLDFASPVVTGVRAFVQVQDVRTWGSEPGTLADTGAITLHQAYLDLGSRDARIGGRIGRQEVSYGEERLVGTVDWSQTARAFDGARLRLTRGAATADAFLYQIMDGASTRRTGDELFGGAYVTLGSAGPVKSDVYLLHNRVTSLEKTSQSTAGVRVGGSATRFSYHAEAALQRGERRDATANAFMATARLGYAVTPNIDVAALYDHLSGDDNPADDTNRVFDTLFATNHKFYGIADVFTNIPLHTAGRGLRDFAVKTTFRVRPDISVTADVHEFRAAADLPAGGASGGVTAGSRFGSELDVVTTYRRTPAFTVAAGVAAFIADDAMRASALYPRDQFLSYIMMTAVFQ